MQYCWNNRKKIFGKLCALVRGYTLSAIHGGSFASIPSIHGYWPKISNYGSLKMGRRFIFRSFRLRPCLCILKNAVLEIGNDGFMNDGVNICASLSIKIGDRVKIGDMSYIYDTDFHPASPDRSIKRKPVVIGHNVWIGANCTILAGSVIGDYAVIGAGSVVTGIIPAKCVAVGTPARVIRSFEAPEGWQRP